MLSLYSSELARRSTWTCLSCTAIPRTSQALIAGPQNRSPAHVHQRKHSYSKIPSPPKDENRAITTPSDAPSKGAKSVVKESAEKRPSTRISKRKSKDGIQDTAGRSINELTFNLPSVPTTNHLHAGGMPFYPLRLVSDWLTGAKMSTCQISSPYTGQYPSQRQYHQSLRLLHSPQSSTQNRSRSTDRPMLSTLSHPPLIHSRMLPRAPRTSIPST